MGYIDTFGGKILGGSKRSLRRLLFSASEPGVTFEPWDITTLYQDRAGTTPVTAAGQSVGLRLDKSKQTYFEPRRNRLTYTEQFDNAAWVKSGATITANAETAPDGTLTADRVEATGIAPNVSQDIVVNSTSVTLSAYFKKGTDATAANALLIRNQTLGTNLVAARVNLDTGAITYLAGSSGAASESVGNGWWKLTLTASITSGNTVRSGILGGYAATVGHFSFIWGAQLELGSAATAYQAVTEFPTSWLGNHEVAVSDAKRGVYGWMPKTGRRNQLTYTEQFDNAVYSKVRTSIIPNSTLAPDNTLTANKLVENTDTNDHSINVLANTTTIGSVCGSIFIKSAGRRYANVRVTGSANGTPNRTDIVVDLQEGIITAQSGTILSATIEPYANGFHRVSLSCAQTTTNRADLQVFPWISPSYSASPSYAGDGTSGLFIWGAQLEVGSTATAYQRVASQYDITEAGVPTCYYVQADGVDDAYVTPTITPNTDKVQVFAGVRKLSDAASGIFIEHSASLGANNGAFAVTAPLNAAGSTFGFGSKGTAFAAWSVSGASFNAPVSAVLTGIGDISADAQILRLNGSQIQNLSNDQGTGNYLAYPAYIYSRGGTASPFNGLDFGHAVRFGPNLDAATIARVESLIARNTPEVTL